MGSVSTEIELFSGKSSLTTNTLGFKELHNDNQKKPPATKRSERNRKAVPNLRQQKTL